MKNSIPVAVLIASPSIPHGSNRCIAAKGTFRMTPSILRLTIKMITIWECDNTGDHGFRIGPARRIALNLYLFTDEILGFPSFFSCIYGTRFRRDAPHDGLTISLHFNHHFGVGTDQPERFFTGVEVPDP